MSRLYLPSRHGKCSASRRRAVTHQASSSRGCSAVDGGWRGSAESCHHGLTMHDSCHRSTAMPPVHRILLHCCRRHYSSYRRSCPIRAAFRYHGCCHGRLYRDDITRRPAAAAAAAAAAVERTAVQSLLQPIQLRHVEHAVLCIHPLMRHTQRTQ